MWRLIRVWQRDFKVWTKYSGVSLISNLGEPLFYILAIGFGLGRHIGTMEGVPYLIFLAPAILSSSIMNSASFETTFSSYTRLTVQKTFDGIMVTPVGPREVILGEMAWAATKSLITAVMMYLVLLAFGLIPDPVFALMVLPVALLSGFLFAAMGMMVTAYARSYDFFAYYFTLILGPMFFFSGTFFSLSELPVWVQRLAYLLPLTHCVQIVRSILFGRWPFENWFHLLWMVFLAILFGFLAVLAMERRLVR